MGIDCTLNSTVSVTVAIGEGQRLNKVVGAAYCGSKEIVSNSQVDLGLGYMISNSNSGIQDPPGEAGCFHLATMQPAPATPSNWRVTCTFFSPPFETD